MTPDPRPSDEQEKPKSSPNFVESRLSGRVSPSDEHSTVVEKHRWVSRRVNSSGAPYAVINSHGPVGDAFVAAHIKTEEIATLLAAAPDLLLNLQEMHILHYGTAAELADQRERWNGLSAYEIAHTLDGDARAAIAKATKS